MVLAGRTGYIHHRAHACERLAALYLRIQDMAEAKVELQKSMICMRSGEHGRRRGYLENKCKSYFNLVISASVHPSLIAY